MKKGEIMEKIIKIEGMHCEGCKKRVENVLNNLGLKNVIVSLEKKEAKIESDTIDLDNVKKCIKDLGFKVLGD